MLPENKDLNFKELLNNCRLIPVAVFGDMDSALKTAEFPLSKSIQVLEITLRTEIAFKCIGEISKKFPQMITGCGSVLSKDALKQALDSGAKFGVAPALDTEIAAYASVKNIPFVPGVATPTELYCAINAGIKFIKVFPSHNLGGPEYIKAIAAPFRTKDFFLIPTGGINESNISEYLKTDRVIACGATYIVDSKLIEKGDFEELSHRIDRTRQLIV